MLKRESDAETAWKCGADLVVRNLEAQGVRHVFGIPGAKVDRVFDSLVDSSIETVVVRHEGPRLINSRRLRTSRRESAIDLSPPDLCASSQQAL